MKIDQLRKLLSNFDENIFFEHDLKKKNWFNIGGKSKVFFKAEGLRPNTKVFTFLDGNNISNLTNGASGDSSFEFYSSDSY